MAPGVVGAGAGVGREEVVVVPQHEAVGRVDLRERLRGALAGARAGLRRGARAAPRARRRGAREDRLAAGGDRDPGDADPRRRRRPGQDVTPRDLVHDHEPDVVSIPLILRAGISQSDEQAHDADPLEHFPANWIPGRRKKCSYSLTCAYSDRKTGIHFCGISAKAGLFGDLVDSMRPERLLAVRGYIP